MHICVEITFSELFLQVCQIYKHHDCKDIFLDLDFLLSLFLLSFVMSGSPRTGFIWLGFCFLSNFLAQVVFVYIKAPHQILFFFTSQFQNKIIPFTGCSQAPSGEDKACGPYNLLPPISPPIPHLGPQLIFEDAGFQSAG